MAEIAVGDIVSGFHYHIRLAAELTHYAARQKQTEAYSQQGPENDQRPADRNGACCGFIRCQLLCLGFLFYHFDAVRQSGLELGDCRPGLIDTNVQRFLCFAFAHQGGKFLERLIVGVQVFLERAEDIPVIFVRDKILFKVSQVFFDQGLGLTDLSFLSGEGIGIASAHHLQGKDANLEQFGFNFV